MWKVIGYATKQTAYVPTEAEIAADLVEGMKNDTIIGIKTAVNYVNAKRGSKVTIGDVNPIFKDILGEAKKVKDKKDAKANKYVKVTDFPGV